MSQITLDYSQLELLKSATSIEDLQTMIARLEQTLPENPERVYAELLDEFKYLDGNSITRQHASVAYNVPITTLAHWEERGLVKVLQKPKRRGLHTFINERDVAVMVKMNEKFRTGAGGPIKGWKPQQALKAS